MAKKRRNKPFIDEAGSAEPAIPSTDAETGDTAETPESETKAADSADDQPADHAQDQPADHAQDQSTDLTAEPETESGHLEVESPETESVATDAESGDGGSDDAESGDDGSRGRPKGAETKDRDTADVQLSRCRRCGSTERTPYYNKKELITRRDPQFTHIVLRYTSCAACGQHRVDRTLEKRTPAKRRR